MPRPSSPEVMTNKGSGCRLRKRSQRLAMRCKSKQKNASATPKLCLELCRTLACPVRSYHVDSLPTWLSGRFRQLCRKGVPNRPPQHVPLWYVDYFELQVIETLWAQGKLLFLPKSFKLGASLVVRVTIRNNFLCMWQSTHLITEHLLFLLAWEDPPPLGSLGPLTSS